jgi:hypothetical protein
MINKRPDCCSNVDIYNLFNVAFKVVSLASNTPLPTFVPTLERFFRNGEQLICRIFDILYVYGGLYNRTVM